VRGAASGSARAGAARAIGPRLTIEEKREIATPRSRANHNIAIRGMDGCSG